jgi:hypothetical protein
MSAMCVDHVCCTSRCGGTCEACDLGATRGDCAAVTSGQPHGSRGVCSGSGPCAGACSAASRTQCTFPDATTSCSCPSVPLSLATCDGAGHCATVSGLCL